MIRHLVIAFVLAPILIAHSTCGCPGCKFVTASFSPTNISFAPQVVGPGVSPGASHTVTLTASGSKALNITALDVSGGFSETNNCASSLTTGQTCEIQISFVPNSVGTITGAITLTSNANGGLHIVSLSGTGLPPVGFSPSILDFQSVAVNATSSSQTVTLTNNQTTGLAINSVGVSGDYSQTNNCLASLAAGQTCQISVQFRPTLAGTIPGTLNVDTDASPGTQPVALTGVGTGSGSSSVGFSKSSLAFGNQEAGSSSSQKSITLTNQGSTSLTIQSVSASAAYASTDSCGGKILSSGASCTINVAFQPFADFVPVDYPGAITIVDSDASSPQVIGLSGSGVAPVSSSPNFIDLGYIPPNSTTAPQTVTLTNNNPAAEGLTLAQSGGLSVANTTCANSLNPGATCNADLTVTTGNVQGPVAGALTVTPSSGGFLSPQVVSLKACVTNLQVSPPSFNFGAVPVGSTSSPETLTISDASFNASATSITGANPGDFRITNNTCTSDVNGSCTIEVTYTPQAGGVRDGTLAVTDDDPCSPQQQLLTGGSSKGPFIVSVTTTGSGTGTVTSSPSGMNCGSNGTVCSASFASGAAVTFTATADAGSHFTGWAGACTGTGSCVLDMNSDKQLTVGFDANPDLSVSFPGNGNGTVTSSPAGINCTSGCDARFTPGVVVTLTATPSTGTTFVGWGGACSGTGSCSVTMTSDQAVTATFTEPTLTVNWTGNGNGEVDSTPTGINCVCSPSTSAPFPKGSKVTLTASAQSGSTFAGWSGACSGTGSCTVTMSADQTVGANFTAPTFSLSGSSPTPGILSPGQGATSTITLTSVNGFNSAVNFTCAVQPAPALGPTCSMNPASATPAANGTVSSTLKIGTTPSSRSALRVSSAGLYAMWLPIGGLAWAGIGLARTRKTRRLLVLLCCILTAGVVLLTACGSSSSSSQSGSSGTPSGNYTVTVTGSSGATQNSTSVTFTVQ